MNVTNTKWHISCFNKYCICVDYVRIYINESHSSYSTYNKYSSKQTCTIFLTIANTNVFRVLGQRVARSWFLCPLLPYWHTSPRSQNSLKVFAKLLRFRLQQLANTNILALKSNILTRILKVFRNSFCICK